MIFNLSKRKTISIVLLVIFSVSLMSLFAGCTTAIPAGNGETTVATDPTAAEDDAKINDVISYLESLYKDDGATTAVDFKRFGIVRIDGVPYEVVWTADVSEEFVKIVANNDGTVTIDVNEACAEDTFYVLTATVTGKNGNTASHSWNYVLPEASDRIASVEDAYKLETGEALPYETTLCGKISTIKTPYDAQYQNITVVITITGIESKPIECYRMKGEGVADIKIGDIITVTGTLKNYNGTIEFDAGCIMESCMVGERVEVPKDPKQIVEAAYKLGANESLPYEVTLTGTIISVDYAYDENYGNITVTIEIEGCPTKPIKCYRMKGAGADALSVGDTITVTGYITNYVGPSGYSTIEFTAGCLLKG